MMAERIDVPPGELGGEALRVPVRVQAHHDHGLRNPVGPSTGCRTARLIEKTFRSLDRVAKSPTMQAGAADAEPQGCGDAPLAADPDGPDPASQIRDLVSREALRRTTAAGREKEEPGAFLIGMPQEPAVRIFRCSVRSSSMTGR